MAETVNYILNEFNAIRKKRMHVSVFGKIVIISFFVAFLVSLCTGWKGNVVLWLISTAVFLMSLYTMIILADREIAPQFNADDLNTINSILIEKNIDTEEKRNVFGRIVGNSLNVGREKIWGLGILGNFLLFPVYFYIIDKMLDNGRIITLNNGNIQFGIGIVNYIMAVIIILAIIGIVNVARIVKGKDKAIRKDMISVIEEIELMEKINTNK